MRFGRGISSRGGRDGTRWYERFLKQVDANVQTFEPVRTEEDEVALLGEHDNGGCGSSAGEAHGEADLPLENAAVRGLKAIDALGANRELFEERPRNPVVLTAGVDHHAREAPLFAWDGQVSHC